MFCPRCGKEIAEGQTFCQYCGTRLAEPAPGTGGREKIPWEDRTTHGFFGGLFKTLKGTLFSPTEFFKKMPVTGGLTDPLLYALIVGMVGLMVSYVWQILFQGAMQSFMSEIKAGWYPLFQGVGIAVMAAISPFLIILWLFIWAGILHLFLMMVRGAKAGFEATFRAASYSYGANIFLAIPICGGLIAMIWSIVLAIIGLKEAHETTGGKATFAVLFPLVLCCGLAVLATLLFMGVVAASFGAMMQQWN